MLTILDRFRVPDDFCKKFDVMSMLMQKHHHFDLGKYEGKPILPSSHILARAMGEHFDLKVVDGTYLTEFPHSWLVSSDGFWVIDVSPCLALGGPLLVDAWGDNMPGKLLYKPGKISMKHKSLGFSTPEFKKAVKMAKKMYEGTLLKEAIKIMIDGPPSGIRSR